MTNCYRFFLILVTTIITSFPLNAAGQKLADKLKEQGSPKERALVQTVELFEELYLSKEIEQQVIEVNTQFNEKLDQLLASDPSKLKLGLTLNSLQKDKNKKLKKLLSNDQYDRYVDMQEEKKEALKEYRASTN